MLNKKSQIFTIIAIVLVLLIFLSYRISTHFLNREPIRMRIETMEKFMFSLEKDLERQMYILGFRTIFLAERYITQKGEYIDNMTELINETFFEGTVYGEDKSEILNGVRYQDIQDTISNVAAKINVNITFDNVTVSLTQEDPWHVAVILEGNLTLEDKTGVASWKKRERIKALVEVENFEDPLFIINTNARISRKINRTIYKPFVSGSDVSNLSNHLNAGLYTNTSLAPSFLDRLEGNMEADENGIESFVNPIELSNQGIPIEDKTLVDYLYFSSQNPQAHHVTGMPSWFKIDEGHVDIYGVSGLIYD